MSKNALLFIALAMTIGVSIWGMVDTQGLSDFAAEWVKIFYIEALAEDQIFNSMPSKRYPQVCECLKEFDKRIMRIYGTGWPGI